MEDWQALDVTDEAKLAARRLACRQYREPLEAYGSGLCRFFMILQSPI